MKLFFTNIFRYGFTLHFVAILCKISYQCLIMPLFKSSKYKNSFAKPAKKEVSNFLELFVFIKIFGDKATLICILETFMIFVLCHFLTEITELLRI